MEATVRPETGLLPDDLEIVALRHLDDGRWETACEYYAGAQRLLAFDADAQAQQRIARALQDEFGFTRSAAGETARRLFEPFELAAGWAW